MGAKKQVKSNLGLIHMVDFEVFKVWAKIVKKSKIIWEINIFSKKKIIFELLLVKAKNSFTSWTPPAVFFHRCGHSEQLACLYISMVK